MDFSKVILMTDLDGTLLTDDKRILPLDLEAIERFRAGGGLFTMATGRGYSMAKHIADKLRLDCPAVVYNGAAVYDFRQEKFLWQCEIGSRAADIIKRVAERYPDIGVEVLRGNVVHVPFLNDTEQWHLNLENVQADWSKLENIPQDGWLKVLFAYPQGENGRTSALHRAFAGVQRSALGAFRADVFRVPAGGYRQGGGLQAAY